MDTNQLIGRIAAAYFVTCLKDTDTSTTARYLLDSLSAKQTAAIAKAILENSVLEPQIELKLPAQWLQGHGLPDRCLTQERATFYRNAPCEKSVLLIATPGDDERQSLADLTIIDSNQLRSHIDLWVRVSEPSAAITEKNGPSNSHRDALSVALRMTLAPSRVILYVCILIGCVS